MLTIIIYMLLYFMISIYFVQFYVFLKKFFVERLFQNDGAIV
jgi:hypothetical protein